MKKILLWMVVFVITIMTGCIKQKNCKDCISGKWIYLKEPIKIVSNCDDEAVAYFYPDSGISEMCITGKVPRKFQTLDTINVCVELESTCPQGPILGFTTYKLKCIEQ